VPHPPGSSPRSLERAPRRRGQGRRFVEIDLVAREQAIEMRDVAVMRLGRLRIPIRLPLLQLPLRANPVRRQLRARGEQFACEIRVLAKNLRRLRGLVEQVAQQLHVHRRPGADRGAAGMRILGRHRGAGDQMPVFGSCQERIEEEQSRSAAQQRIDTSQIGESRWKS
jgi:hypothetical protein